MTNNIEIINVLRNYNIRVGTTDTYPTYYKLKTNYGPKIVNKWTDLTALKNAYKCREVLVKAGFRRINRFIPTKEGIPYVIFNDIGYSLTDEIIGRLPSLTDEKDIKIVGTTLACFHKALFSIASPANFSPWSDNYISGLRHINNIEEMVKKKTIKNNLDEMVLKDISASKEQIVQSIEMAKKVEKIAQRNNSSPKLCHGNLYLTSFLIDEYNEGWIIDLNNPASEMPAYDIAKFILRIYKNSKCNDETIYNVLDSYQEIIPLKNEDKLWILTYIAYPHDLWKFLYLHYVAKVTKTDAAVKEYQGLNNQMFKLLGLYQSLFKYFNI